MGPNMAISVSSTEPFSKGTKGIPTWLCVCVLARQLSSYLPTQQQSIIHQYSPTPRAPCTTYPLYPATPLPGTVHLPPCYPPPGAYPPLDRVTFIGYIKQIDYGSGNTATVGCVCIVHVTVVLMSTCRAPVRELELTNTHF